LQQESIVWFALRDVANPNQLGVSCKSFQLRTDVGDRRSTHPTTPRMNDALWPVREAIESLPASAAPELPQIPEIRCALVRASDHSEGNHDAAMPSNHQSKRIRVGHKPRMLMSINTHHSSPIYSLCSEGPSELSIGRHFISHHSSAWLRTKVL